MILLRVVVDVVDDLHGHLLAAVLALVQRAKGTGSNLGLDVEVLDVDFPVIDAGGAGSSLLRVGLPQREHLQLANCSTARLVRCGTICRNTRRDHKRGIHVGQEALTVLKPIGHSRIPLEAQCSSHLDRRMVSVYQKHKSAVHIFQCTFSAFDHKLLPSKR